MPNKTDIQKVVKAVAYTSPLLNLNKEELLAIRSAWNETGWVTTSLIQAMLPFNNTLDQVLWKMDKLGVSVLLITI